MKDWLNAYYDVAPSTFTPGAIDHITNANYFLKNFKQANPGRLDKCVTHRCSIQNSEGQSLVSIQGVCVEREGENPCGSPTHGGMEDIRLITQLPCLKDYFPFI